MDYTQILENLYVGSFPRTPEDVDTLKAANITAVLNLQTKDDEAYWNIDWHSLKNHYQSLTIEVRRVPVRDFDPIDLHEKLPACVNTLADLISGGQTVYLHCTAGAGRSPTVAIAYLTWNRGWSLAEAATHVQQRRPSCPNVRAIQLATRDLSEE
ncbi:dual specificity protein phosphatase family protein [Acidobacteria bacterium AH-259-D05]|nr:dual specificity protein phosphatase family protein [Acidobacteria bacterium AH-259-D05]